LEINKVVELEQLLKDLKGIPLELAQHIIELDTTIPLAHQARYKKNPNYVIIIKQDIDKLLVVRFIQFVEEATWLSPFVIVPKKNGKLKTYIDFKKLNVTTKKDPYSLPFIDEMLNTITRYEIYAFLDGYSRHHQIFIALEDKYKVAFVIDFGAFIWKVMLFGVKNGPPTYHKAISKTFREYLDSFMKIVLDDFTVYNDMENHM
jgi:hypothetical protein